MNYLDDVVLPVWRFIFNNAALLVVVLSVLAGLCVGLVYRADDDTVWDKYGIPALIAAMCGLFLPVIIGLGIMLLPAFIFLAVTAAIGLGMFLLVKFVKERKGK